ncbi:ArsR family transcriptional regulator [Halobacteriales archaeon QH_10_67_13]|nr:MAG: ArsR family transcriptional regulator [Halobacteriales archaeon QH_10_67_13]
MPELDETDLEIMQLLMADARRPYSEIAEAVGLSAPAVSTRVEKLQEAGVIERFTLCVDRSQLQAGIPVLITLEVPPTGPDTRSVRDELVAAGAVEHVFTTAGGDLVVGAGVPDRDVAGWIADTLGENTIDNFEVELLSGVDWSPDLAGAEFGLTCAQCGNTVDSEGTATRIEGELYQFCCPSCETRFQEKYDRLRQDAD